MKPAFFFNFVLLSESAFVLRLGYVYVVSCTITPGSRCDTNYMLGAFRGRFLAKAKPLWLWDTSAALSAALYVAADHTSALSLLWPHNGICLDGARPDTACHASQSAGARGLWNNNYRILAGSLWRNKRQKLAARMACSSSILKMAFIMYFSLLGR